VEDNEVNMKTLKALWMVVLLSVVIASTGCQSMRRSQEPVEPVVEEPEQNGFALFDFEGIPSREYLVGGGYIIRYRASVDGDLYIAEKTSNRLLATVSLQPGEQHELEFDINDANLTANLEKVGIDAKKAVFRVYFVPR
jgi:hypothetical protein